MTPVTFEDRYDITLEADFETFVPIPVVTLSPRELDLEVLERGLQPVINFVMTNHGLIAAQGVKFTLPVDGHHPFLKFEMVSIIASCCERILHRVFMMIMPNALIKSIKKITKPANCVLFIE